MGVKMTTLSIAVARYDRTQPLLDGRVQVSNFAVEFASPPLEEMFERAFDRCEFDVSELSLSNYLYLCSKGECPYIGLPIFPSRMFRHSAFFVRTDCGIRSPRDLIGRTIGLREYSMTAALTAKGILADEYGVGPSLLQWRYGPADRDDREPVVRMIPRGIDLSPIGRGENLSDLLRDGALDGVVAYKPPKCFLAGDPGVRRLFPDPELVERDYFLRTGIFPLMHLVGIKRDLAAREPQLCRTLCDAFEEAKRIALDALSNYQALSVSLPWAPAQAHRMRSFLGEDPWPYGVAANRAAIDAVARWSFDQGLAERVLSAEELFAESVLDWRPND